MPMSFYPRVLWSEKNEATGISDGLFTAPPLGVTEQCAGVTSPCYSTHIVKLCNVQLSSNITLLY